MPNIAKYGRYCPDPVSFFSTLASHLASDSFLSYTFSGSMHSTFANPLSPTYATISLHPQFHGHSLHPNYDHVLFLST